MGILNIHLQSRKMPGHEEICCLILAMRMSEKIETATELLTKGRGQAPKPSVSGFL